MPMRKHLAALALSLFLLPLRLAAAPSLGAQVIVEPGQTVEQIDALFGILEDSGFGYARIRMFGSHMQMPGGGWDFSLYDAAFDAASRHGIRLFATLFPPTDPSDIGGFKFPRDRKHLEEVGDYIDAVVGHFKDSPALDTWVLQNEPGTCGLKAPSSPLAAEVRLSYPGLSDQQFLVRYTEWYLAWIASRVTAIDPLHGRHINPHQILETLPEYDFAAYRGFLTSLGSSMHFSWHFGAFQREEYPLGVSLMTDLIASGSHGLPYWVTEFQGGNATAGVYVPLCPTADEVTQCIWMAVGAGVQGFMFWTLNPRNSGPEAGEWALLDDGAPSDRLEAASVAAKVLKDNAALFDSAKPLFSGATLTYDNESIWARKLAVAAARGDKNEVMRPLVEAYTAIMSRGEVPCVRREDGSDAAGSGVVLSDNADAAPICFRRPEQHIYMRTMVSGGRYITIMVNKSGRPVRVRLRGTLRSPQVIFCSAGGSVSPRRALLHPEETVVCVWE